MSVAFQAVDNEFAASTGANVGSDIGGSGTSTVDYPPDATKDLLITANEGDSDPFLFDVGDRYDLSYGGMEGGVTLADAVVVRSDALSDGGHAVVFEGQDESGTAVQVVWTPGFDLEQWYWDNFNSGKSSAFYTYDTDVTTAYAAPIICFEGETRIDTPRGPVRAASLTPGTMVDTLDHGPQMVLWVGQAVMRGVGRMAPVVFPAGALGNDRPLVLSQQHRVMHRSSGAELMFAAEEVLIPARAYAMAGHSGARICERPVVRYVHILFERHEIVMAEGVPCESLLLGDVARRALNAEAWNEILAHFPEIDLGPGSDMPSEAARPILRVCEARMLLAPRQVAVAV
ncbi:Hint domain-containing protein [Rhodovulum bhavnagarense]|uniref:Hint domain-containing protein n=1 Tax=Rhodovulum bhavnagarense TaxID=992286 RepID=A0A4R2RR90_9RHOB|nr:Hint domain-containing protein [Rhodovulum bhavnagarense]TCP62381.1 Hint domain-containing protein [Rhodovulum bhavnagarense]